VAHQPSAGDRVGTDVAFDAGRGLIRIVSWRAPGL
jgi:hypothetical protein